MAILKKAASLLLIIVLCVTALPWVGRADAVLAEENWSQDVQNPLSIPGLLSGSPAVIYDSDAHIYRMWYTRSAEEFTGLDSYLSTKIISTLSPDMIKRFKNHDLTGLTAAQKNEIGNLAEAVFSTSEDDILAFIESLQGNIVYAESPNGVDWTAIRDCTFTGTGPGAEYGRTAPTVIKTGSGYEMWYSSWDPDPAVIGRLLNDLLIFSRKIDSTRTAFLIDDIIRRDYSGFIAHLRDYLRVSNYASFQGRLLMDLDALFRTCQGLIGYAVSSDGLHWTTKKCSFDGPGDWDAFGRYSPCIVKRDGSYELWYTGFWFDFVPFAAALIGAGPLQNAIAGAVNISIGKAVSSDGISWITETSDTQVFKGLTTGDGIIHGAASPAVIAGENNSVNMWYCDFQIPAGTLINLLTLGSPAALTAQLESSIYHAATADGGNSWTTPQKIFEKGQAGAWDALGTGEPAVLMTDTQAIMWYTGFASDISGLKKGILEKKPVLQAISDSSTRSAIGRASYALPAASTTLAPTPTANIPITSTRPENTPVELKGFTGNLAVDEFGGAQSDTQLTFDNGNVIMELNKGTNLLGSDGSPLKSLTAAVAGPTPELPQGDHLVSVYNFGPDGATFILNIKAIFRYDVNALPEGTDERNLHVIWWNGSDWKDLGGKINTNDHIVSVSMEHFCLVALAAGISPTGTTAEIGSSDKPSTEPAQMAVNTTTMPITPTEAVPQPKSIFQTVSWGIIILIFAAALAMGYVLYRQIRSNINHHKQ